MDIPIPLPVPTSLSWPDAATTTAEMLVTAWCDQSVSMEGRVCSASIHVQLFQREQRAHCLQAFGHRRLCQEEGIIRTFVQRQSGSCRCSTWIGFKSACRQLGWHSHVPHPGLA